MKDMRIWCKCIKRIQPARRIHDSPFFNLDNSDYSYSEVYLGAKGIVNIYPQDLVLLMSYSVRDGILINIKKNHPYQVLFDYVDGAYYINDDSNRGYAHLVELLSALKNRTRNHQYTEIYENLEAIVFKFVANYYDM